MATIRGILYPLQLNDDGGLKTADDAELLRGHIYSVIETYKYERIMQPDYGLQNLIFSSVNALPVVLERIRITLKESIANCDFGVTGAISDDGDLSVQINWSFGKIPMPPLLYQIDRFQ